MLDASPQPSRPAARRLAWHVTRALRKTRGLRVCHLPQQSLRFFTIHKLRARFVDPTGPPCGLPRYGSATAMGGSATTVMPTGSTTGCTTGCATGCARRHGFVATSMNFPATLYQIYYQIRYLRLPVGCEPVRRGRGTCPATPTTPTSTCRGAWTRHCTTYLIVYQKSNTPGSHRRRRRRWWGKLPPRPRRSQ